MGISSESSRLPRVAAMTFVRDEAEMLPRWVEHYGRELGHQNLIVLDDNTVDGSTDDLPCVRYRLPEGPWDADWGKTRMRLVNGLAQGLRAVNDFVIYTDVDEFLVADPAHHSGLRAYLATRMDSTLIAPLAVEVVHHTGLEPPLDPRRGVLSQRGFVKYAPAMCKPLIRRTNSRWASAFHASVDPFPIDPEVWMFHLKFADEALMRATARVREQIHRRENRGHRRSFWAMSEDAMAARLTAWTEGVTDAPALDPAELDLADLVTQDERGNWQAEANQVESLEEIPLRRLPDRFRSAF